MFITKKEELVRFTTPYRLWQGIPGIEVTKKEGFFRPFIQVARRKMLTAQRQRENFFPCLTQLAIMSPRKFP